MAKTAKVYTIVQHRRGREREVSRTLEEFIEYFRYTLEVGKSWEHERGNKKINLQPKSIKGLITNINNAENNAAANGYSGTWYELKE